MIGKLPESEGNIIGFKATGKLVDEDYKKVIIPSMESIAEKYDKERCLLYLPKSFEGWTPKAMWDDFKIGVGKYRHSFEKIALVGGPEWMKLGFEADSHFTHAEIKVFSVDKLKEAWDWIKS